MHRRGTRRCCPDRPTDDVVTAYVAIAPTLVRRGEVSRSMFGGVEDLPAYLLARLALDQSLHGQGLGSQVLIHAPQVATARAAITN